MIQSINKYSKSTMTEKDYQINYYFKWRL